MNEKIYSLLRRLRSYFESPEEEHKRERKDAKYLLISLTNCGRTWLRLMLGKALQESFNISSKFNPFDLYAFSEFNSQITSLKPIYEIFKQPEDYRDQAEPATA